MYTRKINAVQNCSNLFAGDLVLSQYEIFALDNYNYVATCCTSTKHGGLITCIQKDGNHNLKKYQIKYKKSTVIGNPKNEPLNTLIT